MASAAVTVMPAGEIVRLVQRREMSVTEVVEAHLARIDASNPALNAFVYVDRDGALERARSADAALGRGERGGRLHGLPMSVKSAIAVEGMPWETGSRFRTGVRGDRDATLVTRLRQAGAIVLGVTNAAEQLLAWETDNALYGRTNSPWDLSRTPGGSSGGESAAIAAGLSAGGVGSDGGGSIRVPAHFTGTCGLKPTPGRVPATGHFPVCGGPFGLTGVVGPMARTVADVGLLLEAMAGPDIGDPNGHPVPLVSAAQVAPPLRVGWFEDDGRTPVTGETREAVRAAVKALDGAGFEVVPFATDLLEEARALWWELFGRALRLLLEPLVKGREADVHPNLLEFLDWTRDLPRITAERLLEVEIARDALRTRFAARMVEVPVIVCPVSAVPAFRHGEREWMVDGRRVHYLDAWSYTAWFNLLQNPALSVPAGRSAEGLPIGVQVVARPWEEHMALGVAAVIEDALGGYVPPPI